MPHTSRPPSADGGLAAKRRRRDAQCRGDLYAPAPGRAARGKQNRAESAATLPASIRPKPARWPLSAPAASSWK
ncbi:MAG: hypothetical protein ACLURG_07405 [Gemmiger sp.]